MGVTIPVIKSMSPFVFNADYDKEDFDTFLGWATDQVGIEVPAGVFSPAQEDRAVALLICDFIAQKKTDVGMNSENQGGYTYTRAQPGKTGWMIRYESLLKSVGITPGQANRNQPSQGVVRADTTTTRSFRSSDLPVPAMDFGDVTLKKPRPLK
jgi:hypothetical protein